MSYSSKKRRAETKVEADARKVEHGVKRAGKDVERVIEKGAHEIERAGRKIKRKV
jgi:hypothetical protein